MQHYNNRGKINKNKFGDNMVKRIIFDIDGTLITGVHFSEFVTNALKRYGIDELEKTKQFLVNIKEYENTYSFYDRSMYIAFFSNKLGINLDERFLKIFFDELKNAVPTNSDNIKKMLDNLSNYELVLLSNYFEESQRNRLTTMGINNYFTEYYGEQIIKPNIESYFQAKGDYQPSECIIVGDDKKLDIDVPKSLGFKTLYVNPDGDIKSVEEITKQLIKEM